MKRAWLLGLLLAACNKHSAAPEVAPSALLSVERVSALIKPAMRSGESADLWASDIVRALDAVKQPTTQDNVCAVVAVIEQESGFKADPAVAGIRQILAKKIASMESNPVMAVALNLRMAQTAQNGKTFRDNMKNIHTEHDFEAWYNEFTAEKYTFLGLKLLKKDVSDIVTTAGSMQVSVDYARDVASELNQPSGNIREQIYSRAGGVLYGTAHLLYYPADYSAMYYRFADYNAGHYASRNAAFQKMLLALTRDKKIAFDGDLLSYKDGTAQPSQVSRTLMAYAQKQGLKWTEADVLRDLKREKQADFVETTVYQTIAQLHQKQFGSVLQEQIPTIVLKSDKITRKLTTQWYADNVNRRFKNCLARKI
ncbi:MAG: DUF1615 family protein [Formosimonas sp.]